MKINEVKFSNAVLDALGIGSEYSKAKEMKRKAKVEQMQRQADFEQASKLASVIKKTFCSEAGIYPGVYRRLMHRILSSLQARRLGCSEHYQTLAMWLNNFEFGNQIPFSTLYKGSYSVFADQNGENVVVYIPAFCPKVDIAFRDGCRRARLRVVLLSLEGDRIASACETFLPSFDLATTAHPGFRTSFELPELIEPFHLIGIELESFGDDSYQFKRPIGNNTRAMKLVEVISGSHEVKSFKTKKEN